MPEFINYGYSKSQRSYGIILSLFGSYSFIAITKHDAYHLAHTMGHGTDRMDYNIDEYSNG